MIGWYVHDHGRGHLQRLLSVSRHLHAPVTGLSSYPAPEGFAGEWVQLASDRPTGDERDVTAGGTLHWSPLGPSGLRDRMTAIAAWVERARPGLVVVDVSVEVAVLVRSLGVPVVVVAMRGDRTDRAHRTAYDLATGLLAPWPASTAEPWPQEWLDKTVHVGALSRFDGRPSAPPPGRRRVAVLWGEGGVGVSDDDLALAQQATPDWTWTVGSPDVWRLLQDSDVVVTHAGQSALAEVAAARRPAVVLPQERPFGEQHGTAAVLEARGLAVARPTWPQPEQWPVLLEQAVAAGSRWEEWSDGQGACRAAEAVDAWVRQEVACASR